MDTGYLGRCALFETLTFNADIRRAISRGDDAGKLEQLAREQNLLRDLRTAAARKVASGVTTVEEAISAVMF
jgi:type IV pilus assembly protein PilB